MKPIEKQVAKNTKKSNSRVIKACVVCRRRKIKCNGIEPCNNCTSSGLICSFEVKEFRKLSLYKQEDDIRKDLRVLTHYLKGLENMNTLSSEKLKPLINEIDSKLNEYRDDLRLTIEPRAIEKYDKKISLETALIETDTINFTRYGKVNVKDIIGNDREPLVPSYFGLYSALNLFSSGGFGWVFKKIFAASLDHQETKKTFYLYLKFFDLSSLWFARSSIQKSAPLEWYKKYYKANLPKDICREDLVIDILNNVAAVVGADQFKTEDFRADLILKKITNLISKHATYFKSMDEKNISNVELTQYSMTEEFLHIAFVEFSERYSFSTVYHDNIIEYTISYLEKNHWKEDVGTLRRCASVMTSRAIDAGLSRWEFHIGITEKRADEMRNVWWNCYWWDKWTALLSGKSTNIDDNQISCLLPRGWMEIGINEKMDTEALIKSADFKKAMQNDIMFDVVRYILAKIIQLNISTLLYNNKFTDYKIFSNNYQNNEDLIEELIVNINYVMSQLNMLQKEIQIYFEKIDGPGEVLDHLIIFNYSYIEIISSIENLVTRILSLPHLSKIENLHTLIDSSRLIALDMSRDVLEKISLVENFFDSQKLILITAYYLIHIVVYLIEHPSQDLLSFIQLFCMFLKQFCIENDKRSNIYDMKMPYVHWTMNKLPLFFILILVRMLIQTYLFLNEIKGEDLVELIEKNNPEAAAICRELLDVTSSYYAPLLENIEVSSMHKIALNVINDMTGSQFFATFKKSDIITQNNESSDALNLLATNSRLTPGEDSLSLTNLDDFINLNIFPEIYEVLWGHFGSPLPGI